MNRNVGESVGEGWRPSRVLYWIQNVICEVRIKPCHHRHPLL